MAAIDLNHLERQCGGRTDIRDEVLALFTSDTAAQMQRLEATADAVERRLLAHAIRGAALGIGAFAVAECAARVENSGEAPPSDLRMAMDAACAEIAVILQG